MLFVFYNVSDVCLPNTSCWQDAGNANRFVPMFKTNRYAPIWGGVAEKRQLLGKELPEFCRLFLFRSGQQEDQEQGHDKRAGR
ncbi:MAG: hypothetical protein ABIO24_05790 [Saprospiraceae bacterium]